jgi:hypothetical protein
MAHGRAAHCSPQTQSRRRWPSAARSQHAPPQQHAPQQHRGVRPAFGLVGTATKAPAMAASTALGVSQRRLSGTAHRLCIYICSLWDQIADKRAPAGLISPSKSLSYRPVIGWRCWCTDCFLSASDTGLSAHWFGQVRARALQRAWRRCQSRASGTGRPWAPCCGASRRSSWAAPPTPAAVRPSGAALAAVPPVRALLCPHSSPLVPRP